MPQILFAKDGWTIEPYNEKLNAWSAITFKYKEWKRIQVPSIVFVDKESNLRIRYKSDGTVIEEHGSVF